MMHARADFSLVSAPMLRSASLLVPRSRRSPWLEEWNSELWYVTGEAHTGQSSFFARERRAANFCLGAFHDAMYLRREARAAVTRAVRPSRSSLCTTAALFALAIFSFVIAMLLPNVRSNVHPSPYRDPRGLVLISHPGRPTVDAASMPARNFRYWRDHTRHMFSDFAFYSLAIKEIRLSRYHTSELRIARVSPNLFPILGLEITSPGTHTSLPVLFASPALWQQQLRDQALSTGSEIKVGIRKAIFGGVLPDTQWRLPGAFDAWLIEPDDAASAIPDTARGYIVARLNTGLDSNHAGDHWGMPAPEPGGGFAIYEFNAYSNINGIPTAIFIFTVLLALLALPATTSLPLGEYPTGSERISWSLRLRRWLYLTIKFGLLLPTIYFVSLDLAYAIPATPSSAQYIQIISSFTLALFSFRWALKDQRRRCPVCLSTLTHPARVGEPSRNFLAWNGTELICAGGHGLLHVPELPTSWFSTQRWLYLDSSWSSVFISNV
jgi:hypothetical protein